jgi:hypothetical protein
MTENMSRSNRIVVAMGALLLFNLFVPWYRQDGLGGLFKEGLGSIDAFGAGFLAWFGSLCGVAAAGLVRARTRGAMTGDVAGIRPELISLGLSLAGFILVLSRLITETDSLWLGLLIGLGATLVMTFALLPEAGIQISTAPRPSATTPPPPPPAAGE